MLCKGLIQSHHFMANRWETMEIVTDFIFLGSKISVDGDCSHEIKRCFPCGRKAMTNLSSVLKSRDITLLTKICIVKAKVFPAVMYECENWTIGRLSVQNWCVQTVVLEKNLESPLDSKEIKPINPKGNQSWIFSGRTDAAAEAPIFWPPDVKNWLIWKDPDPGKDWRQEEKGTTEDEMVGWHHRLDGHEWESSRSWWPTEEPGVLQTTGSQSDTTEQLNWAEALV